jgi:hypothetical protein
VYVLVVQRTLLTRQIKLGRFTIATPRKLTEVCESVPYLDTSLTMTGVRTRSSNSQYEHTNIKKPTLCICDPYILLLLITPLGREINIDVSPLRFPLFRPTPNKSCWLTNRPVSYLAGLCDLQYRLDMGQAHWPTSQLAIPGRKC